MKNIKLILAALKKLTELNGAFKVNILILLWVVVAILIVITAVVDCIYIVADIICNKLNSLVTLIYDFRKTFIKFN